MVIGAGELMNYTMVYYASASSCVLVDANNIKVEADLPIL